MLALRWRSSSSSSFLKISHSTVELLRLCSALNVKSMSSSAASLLAFYVAGVLSGVLHGVLRGFLLLKCGVLSVSRGSGALRGV